MSLKVALLPVCPDSKGAVEKYFRNMPLNCSDIDKYYAKGGRCGIASLASQGPPL